MKKTLLFLSMVLLAMLFIFKEPVIATALEFTIRRWVSDEFSYQSRRWENGKLVYEQISLGKGIEAGQAEIEFHVKTFPLCLEAQLCLTQLDLSFDPEQTSLPVLPMLTPHPFLAVQLDIREGKLTFPGETPPLTFSFLSGGEPWVGTWTLDGLGEVAMRQEEQGFAVQWKTEPTDLERLALLVQIFNTHLLTGWKEWEGWAQLEGNAHVSAQGDLTSLTTILAAKEVSAYHAISGLAVKAHDLHFEVAYPQAELHLQGSIVQGEKQYPLQIQGKGEWTSQETFWLETDVDLAASSAFLSFCQPETGKQVLHIDLHALEREGFAFATSFVPTFPEVAFLGGQIAAEVTFWWEGWQLCKVQGEKLQAQDLYIEGVDGQGFFKEVSGNFALQQGSLDTADMTIDGGALRYGTWHATEVAGELRMAEGNFLKSELHGLFMDIPGEIRLEGLVRSPEVGLHLRADAAHWIALVTKAPPSLSGKSLDLVATYHDKKIEGTLFSKEDTIEFSGGFTTEALTCSLKSKHLHLQTETGTLSIDHLENASCLYQFATQTLEVSHARGALTVGGHLKGLFSQGWLQFKKSDAWSLGFHFEQGSFARLAEIECDLLYNGATRVGHLREFSAQLDHHPLLCHHLQWKDRQFDFDLQVSHDLVFRGSGERISSDTYTLHLQAGEERTAHLHLSPARATFDVKWDAIAAQGEARFDAEKALCDFTAITGLLPAGYAVKSHAPLELFWERGLGKFHFALLDLGTQKVVGELKGSTLNHVDCLYRALKATVRVELNLPQILVHSGSDRLVFTISPWRVDGVFQGMEIHFDRSQGRLKIIDGAKAGAFLAHDWLKEVRGVELVGEWKKDRFQGEVRGKEIELKGRKFEDLTGEVDLQAQKSLLKNITLTDPAGTFFFKQIVYDHGHIEIPLFKAHNLRLSPEKPFLIRTLVFSDLRMAGSDLGTLSGRGAFHFTNAWKKESSLFDFPIEILKDLGFDLALFTPVTGQVSCQIEHGKLYLTEIAQTYSEGNRSQFFLVNEVDPSYIDLRGAFHINLRMKQHVLLKFAEPFMLTIRGPLEKPEYSLR